METNSYDYVGNLISQIDGKNNEYKYTYNNLGLLKTEVLPNDESIDKNTIVHRYNAFGEEVFNKDSIGKMTITTRDFEGKVTKEQVKSASFVPTEQKVDYASTYTYTIKEGNTILSIIDGNGKKSEKLYDGLDRIRSEKITITDANGVTKELESRVSYFAGDLISEFDDLNHVYTQNKYDLFGRLIGKYYGGNELIEELSYNKNGLQISSRDALNNTIRFNYDKNNRLIETIDGENNKTTQSYDSNGNVVKKIDAKQNTTDYTYDLRNRLKEVKLQKGTGVDTYSYQYDENDNLTRVQDGEGRVKVYDYNSLNKVKTFKEVELSGMNSVDKYTESYSYYANGSNKSKSINGVEDKTYKNDILGRTKEEKSKSDTITTKYDNNNNILEVKNTSDTITRTFDELNRVKTKTSLGKTLKFTYNDEINGKRAETTKDFNNNVTSRVYDGSGRVIKSIDNKVETNFTYYPNGNKESVEYASGVKEEYSYNKNNSLTKLVNKKGNEILSEYNYTYDANNLLETKVDSKGKTSYSYDKQNRLEVVKEPNKTVTYTYDGAGNRKTEQVSQNGVTTNSIYQYNSTNKLEKVETKQGDKVTSTKTYLYDKKGNVQAELESSKGTELKNVSSKSIEESIKQSNGRGILSENAALNDAESKAVSEDTYKYFSYDDNNNMIAIKDKAGKVISSSKYNGEGLRVQQTTSTGTTNYIYEGNNPILELDANKNVVAKNEYVGNTLLSRNIKNIKYNYLYNGHGDVVNLVNNKGGIENTYYYDSFGNIEESNEKVKNPFKYSKYEHDAETGLYYLKSRMYDPTTARFMQMDTYKGQSNDPLSLNLYTYCVNEPMMYHDPDGHNPLLVLAIAVPVIGAITGMAGEYAADKIDDGKINTDFRHYLAAGITGSLEASFRAFVPIVNIQPLSFGVDIGSNLLYQAIAGDEISVGNAVANATFGYGINGLSKLTSKAYKVGMNKIGDMLMPKINKLIPDFEPKLNNIISSLNIKTNKAINSIDTFTNKSSNKVNSMISNITPSSTKSSTLITETIDNKLNLNKPLMMDLQLFSHKRGVGNPDRQLLSGGEWNKYFKETYGTENVDWITKNKSSFSSRDLLEGHYSKHGNEFGGLYNNADEYLQGAKNVMDNGYKVQYEYKGEIRNGYMSFMGNNRKGLAKFEFVGTNNRGDITTYHAKSGKELWKLLNGSSTDKTINPIK
ncbi:MAG: RHS repeat-associated core domain-containing protein [Clostridium sp.]